MAVYGSCGNFLGRVDHVEGDQIKLTKNDSPMASTTSSRQTGWRGCTITST